MSYSYLSNVCLYNLHVADKTMECIKEDYKKLGLAVKKQLKSEIELLIEIGYCYKLLNVKQYEKLMTELIKIDLNIN